MTKHFVVLLLFPAFGFAQPDSYLGNPQKPLRNYTVHVGIGLPVLFTVTAEVQAYEQLAIGVKYSRQWLKESGSDAFPILLPLGPQRFVYGSAIGITASYFLDNEPQQFLWYTLPNRIRTEVALVVPTPVHDISPDRNHAFGLSWELLLGLEYPYKGVGFYADLGALLMSLPNMIPVIGPVFKFGLALNL